MPRFRRLHSEQARALVREMIPNNNYSPMSPYLILVRSAGIQAEYIKFLVFKSKGKEATDIHMASKTRVVWSMSAYYGTTKKSSFKHRLALAIEAREFFNILHRIECRKQPVTQELMRSVTTPHLKEKLIEAICKAAL